MNSKLLVTIVVLLQTATLSSLSSTHDHDDGNLTSTTSPASKTHLSSNGYVYGTVAVALISASSLLGAVLIPSGAASERSPYVHYVLAGFIAMGVGILIGDALIHLVPQAIGLHDHDDDDGGHSTSLPPHLGKCLTMVAAIYLLFLFESVCLVALPSGGNLDHEQDHGHSHQMQGRSTVKSKSVSQQTLSSVDASEGSSAARHDNEHVDENSSVTLDSTPVVCCGLRNLALIITLGDAFHNFADGLVIGTSFATGTREGIASSLAITCHELPHELSDFAVLLSTGLSRTKAIVVNLVASSSSFAGLYIGLSIGSNESAIQWTMSITIGMFLFVALGDMMPELKSLLRSHSSPWTMLSTQNAAMLLGIGFTVAMAVYETDISLAL